MYTTPTGIIQFGRERPWTGLVVAFCVFLVADLALKLLGTELFVFGAKALGGSLSSSTLTTYILDGVIVGMAIGLAGVGLSMTYSILSFANFAHGDYVTSGAFIGWMVAYVVAAFGLTTQLPFVVVGGGTDFATRFLLSNNLRLTVFGEPFTLLVGLVAAAAGTIGLSLVLDRVVYRPMRDANGISLLIASIGVALALRYLIAFVWQTGKQGVTGELTKVTALGFITLTSHEWTLLVVGSILMVGVHVLLQFTKLGTAMRAMADNKALARVSGIPVERVTQLTWIVGGGLAGVAGYLLVLEGGTIAFNFGWTLLLLIFSAVILGGIGSIYGAMAGGLFIGVVDKIALVWLPSDLTRASVFVVLIVVLLVRPEGLFGGVKTA